ncbi:MAG: DUF2279 domain-containing protein [Luteibaculaceae bacterium]
MLSKIKPKHSATLFLALFAVNFGFARGLFTAEPSLFQPLGIAHTANHASFTKPSDDVSNPSINFPKSFTPPIPKRLSLEPWYLVSTESHPRHLPIPIALTEMEIQDNLVALGWFSREKKDTLGKVKNRRLGYLIAGQSAAFVGSMSALYITWYGQQRGRGFTFEDDFKAWQGMDKLGHANTAYRVAFGTSKMFEWAHVDRTRAAWYGTGVSLLFLSTVEVFDGFSDNYGFSVSDFGANVMGAGLFLGQELLWQEQRMELKFAFRPSPFATYRPELLGEGAYETWLKDYNGQSYWLSINPTAFGAKKLPGWLNVALGYSASGMTGSFANPAVNGAGQAIPSFNRTHYFYLSPDISFRRIPTESKVLKTVFFALDIFKFPLPGMRISNSGQVIFQGLAW